MAIPNIVVLFQVLQELQLMLLVLVGYHNLVASFPVYSFRVILLYRLVLLHLLETFWGRFRVHDASGLDAGSRW